LVGPKVGTCRTLYSGGASGVCFVAMSDPSNSQCRDPIRGPLAACRERRRAGLLAPDPAQELAAEKLQSLHHALRHHTPETGRNGWKERLGLGRRRHADPPQGLYLFGAVGRGKSMLMDLFFATAPVERKRRTHFHEFMLDVHDRLHAMRRDTDDGNGIIALLADDLAAEAWLLCFDELHVQNIADAMILGRLFEALFDRGVVVVATSNWPPDRLYEGGLQRDRFLPFIALIKARLDILHLEGPRDYRRDRIQDMAVYHCPLGPKTDASLDDAFARLTEGAEAHDETVAVKSRNLHVPCAARGVARFHFAELCECPLGAADFLALAARYHTLILAGVPVLRPDQRNEAQRFMTLVDALYEHRVKLVIGAAAPPDALYPAGDGSFDFQRAASRLVEMRSSDYLRLPHSP
jgi:cell division protein ZapE